MRLRVQTLPPLPKLKIWFCPFAFACRDQRRVQPSWRISDLKALLCEQNRVLKEAVVEARDVMLFVDDYELSDQWLLRDVLRDGDEVIVKYRLTVETGDDDAPAGGQGMRGAGVRGVQGQRNAVTRRRVQNPYLNIPPATVGTPSRASAVWRAELGQTVVKTFLLQREDETPESDQDSDTEAVAGTAKKRKRASPVPLGHGRYVLRNPYLAV